MLGFALETAGGAFVSQLVPNESHVELLQNDVSFAELVFDEDDPVWGKVQDGHRLRCLYEDGSHLMGGVIESREGEWPQGAGILRVEDDFRLFRLLGWQTPDAAITAQTNEYARYTGHTETVVKAACADLSDRLGLGWSIPSSANLGTPGRRVEFRMHPLVDKLKPLVDQDLLTWSIQDGVVDVTQGDLFPRVLTFDTGLIEKYRWKISMPTVTRDVVGGSGEGTAREFAEFVDTGREATWGQPAEVFKDSRMADGEPLDPDGAEALAAGAGQASVAIELNESSWFRYGKYVLGTRLEIDLGMVQKTDVITRITFDETPENGLVVTPHVGSLEVDVDSRLGSAIGQLARRVRDQGGR
ncbi:hypothetical protein [Microbacterium sp. 2FI]|uniref:Gp37-like protein n=1 Tax=Microbacterium sp. 2FI TaxID=2502193 RepID=UPI0010F75345|nr:hypothetical protein [Microbacterium sp. 2FI]